MLHFPEKIVTGLLATALAPIVIAGYYLAMYIL